MKAQTADFKARLAAGDSYEDILIEAFALVREASVRTIGLPPLRCAANRRHRLA